jgi:hypothetical protein
MPFMKLFRLVYFVLLNLSHCVAPFVLFNLSHTVRTDQANTAYSLCAFCVGIAYLSSISFFLPSSQSVLRMLCDSRRWACPAEEILAAVPGGPSPATAVTPPRSAFWPLLPADLMMLLPSQPRPFPAVALTAKSPWSS